MKILLIEDNEDDAGFVLRMCQDIPNLTLETAQTLRDGQEKVLSLFPDVILLDVVLPDLERDGLRNAVATLRGWGCCIVTTARDEANFSNEVEADGADEFLPKKYITGRDNRYFLTRLARGYACYRDRMPTRDPMRQEEVAREITEAMRTAQNRVARGNARSAESDLSSEQNLLLISLSNKVLKEMGQWRTDFGHLVHWRDGVNLRHQEEDDTKLAVQQARAEHAEKVAARRQRLIRFIVLLWGPLGTILCGLIIAFFTYKMGWLDSTSHRVPPAIVAPAAK